MKKIKVKINHETNHRWQVKFIKMRHEIDYAGLKNTRRRLLSNRSKHKHNTDLITQKHCGIQASYERQWQPMRSLSDSLGCHFSKINSDISTSLCTSCDVEHVPQFTDAHKISDNIGARREHQNKDERAVLRETGKESRSLTQLTTSPGTRGVWQEQRLLFQFVKLIFATIWKCEGKQEKNLTFLLFPLSI